MTVILTRADLLSAYAEAPIDAVALKFFKQDAALPPSTNKVIFFDDRTRRSKVLKNRVGKTDTLTPGNLFTEAGERFVLEEAEEAKRTIDSKL